MKNWAIGQSLSRVRLEASAAFLCCLPIGVAVAQPTAVVTAPIDREFTERVSYADLDLATNDGRKMLFRRVRSAVKNVCSEMLGPATTYYQEHADCRRATWSDTRPQMNLALDEARNGSRQAKSGVAATVKVSARE